MPLIYKLLHRAERVGEWKDLRSTAEGVQSYLEDHSRELEQLSLTGYLTSYERGATQAFTVAGADIPAYLIAATTALAPSTEADDAATALARLPDEQRLTILDLLRPSQRRRVQALIEHGRPTAGQVMSPEFICLYENQTVQHASDRVRATTLSDEVTAKIFVVNQHQRLEGAVPLAELLRAAADTLLRDLTQPSPSAQPETELDEIATLMAEHDTTIIPVIDKRGRPAGVIIVDDVLELLLSTRWGAARPTDQTNCDLTNPSNAS